MEENNNVEVEKQEVKEENCNCGCECTKKAKKHGAFYWIIVLFGTAFIMVACYNIGYKLGKHFGEGTNSSTPSSNENEVKTPTDEEKNDIYKKIALLLSTEYKGEKLIKASDIGTDKAAVFENNLDDKAKGFLILKGMSAKEATIDVNTVAVSESQLIEDIKAENGKYYYYSIDEFVNNYKLLFNEEPKKVDYVGCPAYYYDKKGDRYFQFSACGSATILSYYLYVDSIEYGENDSLVATIYAGSSIDGPDGMEFYNDYLKFDDESDDVLAKTVNEKTINEQNKTSFTKYNMSFKKVNGNYYYNNTTKAN